MSCRREIESLAINFKSAISLKFDTRKIFGLSELKQVSECVHWVRGSYYTPPPKTTSTVPYSLFGTPPPDILAKLESAYEEDTGHKYQQEADEKDIEEYDMYSWKQIADGKFYNKYTKSIADSHPLYKKDKEKQKT